MKKVLIIGSINMDLVIQCDTLPAPGETLLGHEMAYHSGGKGANQAVAAARLGGAVSMIGGVGGDDFGVTLLAGLERELIDTAAVQVHLNSSSGIAIIHVDRSGENTITVIPGANALLTPDIIQASAPLIEAADVVLLQLEIPIESVIESLRIARTAGVPVVLDPAPAPKPVFPAGVDPREVMSPSDHLPDGLFNVDIISPNQTEAQALTGIDVYDLASAAEAGRRLIDRGALSAVIKAGHDGAYVITPGGEPAHVPAYATRVVDTTAAGDAFSAALALTLAEGASLTEATRRACAAGSLAVTRRGAQSAMPYKHKLDALHAGESEAST